MSAAIWSFQQVVALRACIPTWTAVSPASWCSTQGPGPTRDSGVENKADDGVKKPDTRVVFNWIGKQRKQISLVQNSSLNFSLVQWVKYCLYLSRLNRQRVESQSSKLVNQKKFRCIFISVSLCLNCNPCWSVSTLYFVSAYWNTNLFSVRKLKCFPAIRVNLNC